MNSTSTMTHDLMSFLGSSFPTWCVALANEQARRHLYCFFLGGRVSEHCSGKEIFMHYDDFFMLHSLAANCSKYLLSILVAVNFISSQVSW